MSRAVALYASNHGFGHATRMYALGTALVARGHRVVLVAGDAASQLAAGPGLSVEEARLDFGFVAVDGQFALDLEATRGRLPRSEAELEGLVAAEVERLRRAGAQAVIADAPVVALLAAHRAGLPAAVVGNFTWLDQYQGLFGPELEALLGRAYSFARVAIRLWPGGLEMRGVRDVVDVRGVLARRALGTVPDRGPVPTVALGMGKGLDWDPAPLEAAITRAGGGFRITRTPEQIAGAGLVIAKAGYSTVAEALLHARPLIAVPLPGSRESAAIAGDVQRAGAGLEVSFAELEGLLSSEGLTSLIERARPRIPIESADGAILAALGAAGVL